MQRETLDLRSEPLEIATLFEQQEEEHQAFSVKSKKHRCCARISTSFKQKQWPPIGAVCEEWRE